MNFDNEEVKKFNILENIFKKINSDYVSLPDDQIKRNNRILQVIDRIIQTLYNKSVLFKNLFQNKFYGGSYYDGLKVGEPSEYDLDCILRLPKIVAPKVEVSDKPGYVHIVLKNMKALEEKAEDRERYAGLDKLLDGNRLSTMKVKSWMESLMTSAINGNSKTTITVGDRKYIVKYKMVKSGPALTIKLDGEFEGTQFNMDIDLVPCFIFSDDQWPKNGYKPNPSSKKKTFLVVPKSPSDSHPLHWRLSFQEQERELLTGHQIMKPAIRLIKKLRDRHHHKIASYYIKTVFLWELEKTGEQLWKKSLSFAFVTMLKKYSEYIESKNIPYYWNKSNNLIGDLSKQTAFDISRKIKNIVDHIVKICNTKSDIYDVVSYFLSKEEVDIEDFKQGMPTNKKLLKLQEQKEESASSSFEEIPKVMTDDSNSFQKLEILLHDVASQQKQFFTMVENYQNQIKELKTDNLKILQRVCDIDNKIDTLKEGSVKKDDLVVDELLGQLDDKFKGLNFEP